MNISIRQAPLIALLLFLFIASGLAWWKMNYGAKTTGWHAENYIPKINVPLTPNKEPSLKWGAYVGDGPNDLADFEKLVGKKTDLYADFEGWSDNFPSHLAASVGKQGKTLVIFWEPSFGYDRILNKSQDKYISAFAAQGKAYAYPVILVPFPEMNLNEEAWGHGVNGNTATKFKEAWLHVHGLFSEATNVKFGLAYNNVSIPDAPGNALADYYPGDHYVDIIGVDGFNFNDPWLSFSQVFDQAMSRLSSYHKPIYIFSMASAPGSAKAEWIKAGLGKRVKEYPGIAGWIWFNENKSTETDWRINSDEASLDAFRSIISH